jgi:Lsr2
VTRKVNVVLVDDIDGQEAEGVETVRFALDGMEYEIDLNPVHAGELHTRLGPFLAHARKVKLGTVKGGKAKAGSRQPRTDLPAIRAWARVNGWPDIAARGRVPAAAVAAYDRAH